MLLPLSFLHEMGHYATARMAGFTPDSFNLGVGKTLFEVQDSLGTFWRLNIFPLVSYVDLTSDFEKIAATQGLYIFSAGVVVNLLIGLACMAYCHIYSLRTGMIYRWAYWSITLGLFNLLPWVGLDGEKVLGSLVTLLGGGGAKEVYEVAKTFPYSIGFITVGVFCYMGINRLFEWMFPE